VIAYKGAGPMLNDIMGGQIHLICDPMLSSLPLAQSNKIKALAITSLKRVPAAPEIPTVEESGLEKMEFVSWYGLWGPKDMPADLVAKIQSHAVKVLAETEVKQKMGVLGFEAIGTTPAEFAKFIDKEMATYSKIIKDANIKAE
jgi:tripartite-type tricarboxylate transporter receptor subunit TctC